MTDKLSDGTFDRFQKYLVEQAGLFFTKDRAYLLEERLRERMKALRMPSYEEYLHFLLFHPDAAAELKNLLDILTIGETSFFRNEPQFQVFAEYCIPKFGEKREFASKPSLTIWSAGCSTGEEPYTIAMVLSETLPAFEDWNISIVATDINRVSIAKAEEGLYSGRSLNNVPQEYLDKYFMKRGEKYAVSNRIKRMVHFQYHNLVQDLPPESVRNADMIICRNVTIYFGQDTIKTVVGRFAEYLAPGGFLFIGHAETLWGISDAFLTLEFPHTFIYQRPAAGETAPRQPAGPSFPLPLLKDYGCREEEECGFGACEDHAEGPGPAAEEAEPVQAGKQGPEFLEQATRLADEGNYEAAEKCLQKLIKEDKLCAPAYYLLGILYTKTNAYEKAAQVLQQGLYLAPELAAANFQLGNIYRHLGEAEKAKREYRNCLKTLSRLREDETVPFAGDITAGVLSEAVRRAMEGVGAL